MSTPTSDYDATWKYLAERHLGDLIAHTFPALHRRIDWQRGMINHDRELAGLAVTATRALHSDRLIEVFLRPPRRRSLLVHLEFQSQVDHDLTDFLRVAHRILPVSSARSGDIYATMRAILIKEGLMVQTSFLAPEELAAEARGEIQGQRQLLIKLLSRRFPQLSASDTAAVEHLAPAQLDQLADVLLSLADLQALRAWLAGQRD